MKCVLKDLIAVSKDGEWGKGEQFEDSVEMLAIRGTDFADIRFGLTANTPRRHIAKRHAERKILRPWDVIIEAAGGTKNQITGRTVLLRPELFARSELPFTCASFSRFIRFNTELCDPAFMFWYLQHLYNAGSMHAYHTQHTGVARFQWTTFSEREPLTLPTLAVQQRVAGILSAYDELIENSQRRIKILEAMARGLYREWFVHFRYPCHENHRRVASVLGEIPEGWEVKTVEEMVKRISVGKKYDQKTVTSTGAVPVFDQGKSGIIGYHDDEPGVVASETAPVIVFSNHTCYQRLVHIPFSAIQNVLPFLPSPAIFRNIYWLHWATNGLVVFNDYKGHWPEFSAKSLIVPPSELCQRFGDFAMPLSIQVLKLERQVDNLRRTRDLLLPSLLSGQIEIRST